MTAAANKTKTVFNYNGNIPVIFSFTKAATADWTIFGDYPGVIDCRGTLYTGADEGSLTYGTMTGPTSFTATATSLAITSGVTTRVPPYYIEDGLTGEIMMVISETAAGSSSSTLTVKRGCLGTTAAANSGANDTLYILNCVIWGAATTGLVTGHFLPMPEQPDVGLFGTAGN
jgi:hypothetical protein